MSMINQLIAIVEKLPPDVLASVFKLLQAVASSDDPARTAERHAAMIAARKASHEALEHLLQPRHVP